MKTYFLFVVLAVAFLCPITFAANATAPNIVFILADDLGHGDTSTYGSTHNQIPTPNIDALAKGGLKFNHAYASASVCVPTRVALMTGRYPWRFGPPVAGGQWGFLGLRFDPALPTLGRMMHNAGYQSNYVGKWHLGTTMTTRDGQPQNENNVDYTQPLIIGPPQFGFDHSFILPGSLDMFPYAYILNNYWQGEVTAKKGWSAFNRVGDAEKDFEDHEVLETFYHQAENVIAKQQPGKPFFLMLALTAPHTPTSPGVNFQGKSKIGVYGDSVLEVDHAVQRVVNALKAQKLYDNTLIIFSSDHGAASYAGANPVATPGQMILLEKQGHYANWPHRGYKFSAYEGGLRVPLIAHWPNVIKPGLQTDAVVGLNDLFATFADLASAKLKPEIASDSISFANILRNPKSKPNRKSLIMQGSNQFVIRDGDWKLMLCPGSAASGKHGNEPASEPAWRNALKAFGQTPTENQLAHAPFVQLFNVKADPHEDKNRAAQNPDRVDRLFQILKDTITQNQNDIPVDPIISSVRKLRQYSRPK